MRLALLLLASLVLDWLRPATPVFDMKDPNVLWGATMTAGGTTGLTIQVLTEFGSLAAVLVNLLLGIGGLYLMWPKIKRAWRERK